MYGGYGSELVVDEMIKLDFFICIFKFLIYIYKCNRGCNLDNLEEDLYEIYRISGISRMERNP